MAAQKLTVQTDDFILKESYIDQSGNTVWDIKDPKHDTSFIVHASSTGSLFVKFFKGNYVSNACSLNSLRELCKILVERNLEPTIRIPNTNKKLIGMCYKIGFKKKKGSGYQYYLKQLK